MHPGGDRGHSSHRYLTTTTCMPAYPFGGGFLPLWRMEEKNFFDHLDRCHANTCRPPALVSLYCATHRLYRWIPYTCPPHPACGQTFVCSLALYGQTLDSCHSRPQVPRTWRPVTTQAPTCPFVGGRLFLASSPTLPVPSPSVLVRLVHFSSFYPTHCPHSLPTFHPHPSHPDLPGQGPACLPVL